MMPAPPCVFILFPLTLLRLTELPEGRHHAPNEGVQKGAEGL